jgi:hypothetical protein
MPAVVLGCLIFADWTEARHWDNRLPQQVGDAIEYGDHLHFVSHLVLGRLLSLTPWTKAVAADQYDRASAHATTARQRALVTSDRPQSPSDALLDLVGIIASGLRWGQRGAAWLLVRSPLG